MVEVFALHVQVHIIISGYKTVFPNCSECRTLQRLAFYHYHGTPLL
ncbi:MAG: hypothetical protein IJU07_06365 [Synergistaceae bacterium]|nr:hypothetical protein [Synergistaceae bacterium]